MADFDQEIEYTWLFVLSIPTLYFFSAILFYNQHLASGFEYERPCDTAEESLLDKANCEVDTFFNIGICVVIAT